MIRYSTFVKITTLKKAEKVMIFNAAHSNQYLVLDMPNGYTYMYPNTNYNQEKLEQSGRKISEWHANMN